MSGRRILPNDRGAQGTLTPIPTPLGDRGERVGNTGDAEDAPQGRPAAETLRRLRAALRLAEEMGAGLGHGAVLFRPLPGPGAAAREIFGEWSPFLTAFVADRKLLLYLAFRVHQGIP